MPNPIGIATKPQSFTPYSHVGLLELGNGAADLRQRDDDMTNRANNIMFQTMLGNVQPHTPSQLDPS